MKISSIAHPSHERMRALGLMSLGRPRKRLSLTVCRVSSCSFSHCNTCNCTPQKRNEGKKYKEKKTDRRKTFIYSKHLCKPGASCARSQCCEWPPAMTCLSPADSIPCASWRCRTFAQTDIPTRVELKKRESPQKRKKKNELGKRKKKKREREDEINKNKKDSMNPSVGLCPPFTHPLRLDE